MAVTNYFTIDNEIIGEKTTGSSRVDYLTDMLGSVTATVNQSAQIVNTYRNKPYGSQLAKTGVGADPAFQWNGTSGYRQTNNKFSEDYVRGRHYGSSSGNWISRDVLFPMQPAYIYANSAPILVKDPFGLAPFFITPSCDKDSAIGQDLTNCCSALKRISGTNLTSKIIKCMRHKLNKPIDQTDPILNTRVAETLRWLSSLCQNQGNAANLRVCIWCLDTPKPGVSEPSGWPPDCKNPCDEDTLMYTPLPVGNIPQIGTGPKTTSQPGPPIRIVGTGCPALIDPEMGCEALRIGPDKKTCNAVIVFCPGRNKKYDTCENLFHELVHVGGLAGQDERHRQKTPPDAVLIGPHYPGTDFIFALACCLCIEMKGNDKLCNNCKDFVAIGK